jgi:hypothetical protein
MNDNQTLARFLKRLWRGGNFSFLCTHKWIDNEDKHGESLWIDLRENSLDNLIVKPPTDYDWTGVFFGVHSCRQIPPENLTTGNPDPRWIRSQLADWLTNLIIR